jgi:hypothetical protein
MNHNKLQSTNQSVEPNHGSPHGTEPNIYDELVAAGIPIDSHESDLYAKVTPESREIVRRYQYKSNVQTFRNLATPTRELWYDIPFAYSPFWRNKQAR